MFFCLSHAQVNYVNIQKYRWRIWLAISRACFDILPHSTISILCATIKTSGMSWSSYYLNQKLFDITTKNSTQRKNSLGKQWSYLKEREPSILLFSNFFLTVSEAISCLTLQTAMLLAYLLINFSQKKLNMLQKRNFQFICEPASYRKDKTFKLNSIRHLLYR